MGSCADCSEYDPHLCAGKAIVNCGRYNKMTCESCTHRETCECKVSWFKEDWWCTRYERDHSVCTRQRHCAGCRHTPDGAPHINNACVQCPDSSFEPNKFPKEISCASCNKRFRCPYVRQKKWEGKHDYCDSYEYDIKSVQWNATHQPPKMEDRAVQYGNIVEHYNAPADSKEDDSSVLTNNNKLNKESTMSNNESLNINNMFGNLFSKLDNGQCRLSIDGRIAVRTDNGYKTYNAKTNRLVNYHGNFCFDIGQDFFFVMPATKVKIGDIVILNDEIKCVIDNTGKTLKVVSYEDGTVNEIIPERSFFMGQLYFYKKIISLFNLRQGKAKGFGQIMKLMMLKEMMKGSDSGTNTNNLMPMMMMSSMMGNSSDFDLTDMLGLDSSEEIEDFEELEEDEEPEEVQEPKQERPTVKSQSNKKSK